MPPASRLTRALSCDETLIANCGKSPQAVYSTSARLPSLVLRQGRCAVKRLSSGSVQGLDELLNEIRLLGKCRHENLLPLLGLFPQFLLLILPLFLFLLLLGWSLLRLLSRIARRTIKLIWGDTQHLVRGTVDGQYYAPLCTDDVCPHPYRPMFSIDSTTMST